MISAYFPFTFLSQQSANNINYILGKFIVYQPVSSLTPSFLLGLQNEGILSLETPEKKYESEIRLMLDDCHTWIATKFSNKSVDVDFLKTTLSSVPFYNTESTTAILDEIRGDSSKIEDIVDYEKTLFNSYLFLALAHKNDFNRYEYIGELEKFRCNRERFINMLGENSVKNNILQEYQYKLYEIDYFRSFKLMERIRAWSTLVLMGEVVPNFLITDAGFLQEFIFNFVESEFANYDSKLFFKLFIKDETHNNSTEILEDIRKLVFKKDLNKLNLSSLNKFGIKAEEIENKILMVFVFPQLPLEKFLVKFSKLKLLSKFKKANNKVEKALNTVIVFVK